jgi:hypothetical protein
MAFGVGLLVVPMRSAKTRCTPTLATTRPLETKVCLFQPDNGDLSDPWIAFVLAVFATLMDSGFADFRHRDEDTSEPHGGFVLD